MTLPADPLFLGLDLGTSGVRGCAVDGRGEEAASAAAALPETAGKGEKREQEPAHWWAAVEQVVAELAAKLAAKGAAGRVAALAVDGTSGTLLLADAGGEPIGPAVMYDDRRAVNEAELIAFRTASEGPRASAAHGTGSALAKLLFLHRFGYTGRARHALNQADWIVGRLTGRYGVSDDNNALKMGFDPLERRWPEWIATLGFSPGLLPQVVTPGSAVAPLRPELATRWGLPATLPVVAGTTDSTAAFIASGATKPGEAMTALGSTLVTKVLSEEPVFSPEHGVYSHRLGRLWVVGGEERGELVEPLRGEVGRQHRAAGVGVLPAARHRRALPGQRPLPGTAPLAAAGRRSHLPARDAGGDGGDRVLGLRPAAPARRPLPGVGAHHRRRRPQPRLGDDAATAAGGAAGGSAEPGGVLRDGVAGAGGGAAGVGWPQPEISRRGV